MTWSSSITSAIEDASFGMYQPAVRKRLISEPWVEKATIPFFIEGSDIMDFSDEKLKNEIDYLVGLGFQKKKDCLFRAAPHLFTISSCNWEKLKKAHGDPVKTLCELIPDLIKDYTDYLKENMADDLVDIIRIGTDVKDWLNAPVRLNIDQGSEYALNSPYPSYWHDSVLDESFCESSLMWLTRRQGYNQKQMYDELYDSDEAVQSRYLRSAAREVCNEYSSMNQLGFFVRVTVEECLLMLEAKKYREYHWSGYLLLDTKTTCGFFTTAVGTCSSLGIELEKPVKLTLDDAEVFPDGARGYSVFGVKGRDVWKTGCILHWGLSRQFRRDMSRWGYLKLPEN